MIGGNKTTFLLFISYNTPAKGFKKVQFDIIRVPQPDLFLSQLHEEVLQAVFDQGLAGGELHTQVVQ